MDNSLFHQIKRDSIRELLVVVIVIVTIFAVTGPGGHQAPRAEAETTISKRLTPPEGKMSEEHDLTAAYMAGRAAANDEIRELRSEIERLRAENRKLMEQLSDKAYRDGRYITLQEFMEHRKQQAAEAEGGQA